MLHVVILSSFTISKRESTKIENDITNFNLIICSVHDFFANLILSPSVSKISIF